LDATCILYKGKKHLCTIDYRHKQTADGAVQHSGDVMQDNGGSHTMHLNLEALDPAVTSCVFVISAWAEATLSDIVSSSISFSDADAGEQAAPLCIYDLDAHDKISYLKSVIMCRLYRAKVGRDDEQWHVQAIGDAHKGAADNYGPIYAAVEKLL
jgi:stress response protein SCP2